ncbi:MAG: hypothetical protein ACREXU_11450 [Gammaproteobacteria bacterium]
MFCGGAFAHDEAPLRYAFRVGLNVHIGISFLGFRVVVSPSTAGL